MFLSWQSIIVRALRHLGRFKTYLALIALFLILFVGILSIYCAQQGYLEEAVWTLICKSIARSFFDSQICPKLCTTPVILRFFRQVSMSIAFDSIILPATISFYFDLELFSPFHVFLLFFSSVQFLSRVYYATKSLNSSEEIMQYNLFGFFRYPLTAEFLAIPLLFHVYGFMCIGIQTCLWLAMLFVTILNLPRLPIIFSYCFSEQFAATVFKQEKFSTQSKFKIYGAFASLLNGLVRKAK